VLLLSFVARRRRPRTVVRLPLTALALLLWVAWPTAAETLPSDEYRLKAALIYKLARFVTWP
jgi:hypothetical protein